MRGEFSDAESSYRTAISSDPYNAIYHANLAASLNAQKKFDEAEKEMDLAARLSPESAKFKEYLDLIRANKNKGTFYKIEPTP
jgi:Tfp pilus assembly protein PilF